MAATADRIDRVSIRLMADLLGVTVEEYAARRVKNSPGQMSLWDDNATGSNLLRAPERQKSFDWDESKHPRADDGKFAEVGAGKSSGGGAAVAEVDDEKDADEPEESDDDAGEKEPPAKPAPEPEPEDDPSPIAPPEPDPAKTPRENAEAAQRKLDADYEFARASAISNAGEDLKGSARHIRNQWRTLEDAETEGIADHLVTRDQLLKNEPHSLAMHAESNPVGSLMLHEVLRAFPPKPGYGSRNVGEEAAKKNRANYLDVYRKVKGEAEKIAASGENQVQDISRAVGKIVADEIRRLRATEGKTDDTANGLVNYYGALSKFWQKSSIATKVSGFLSEAGITDPDSPDGKAADIALQVMEGKTFSQILGREKGPAKPKGFSEAELYVATAERTGGPELPVKTAKESLDYLVGKVGLRGVQFGNSVSDAEREHHAKMSAGAMLDLADMTGLPLEAVSLGGKLGLAMGARGKGNALAHYEPGTKVINLTRKGGVGSLAHEWGHAFDNIISADYARKNTPYLSEDAFPPETPVSGAMKALRIAWDSSGYKSRLRSELQKRINNKTMTAKKANDYWNTNLEIFARSFERHIQRKLEKGGRKSTYLAGIESKAYKSGGLWPTDEEVDKMAPEFDRLFDAYREHGLKIADRVKYSAADRDRLADRFIAEMLGMTVERYESERAELTTGKHGDRGRYVTTDNGSQIFLTKSGEIGQTGKNIGGDAGGGSPAQQTRQGNRPGSIPKKTMQHPGGGVGIDLAGRLPMQQQPAAPESLPGGDSAPATQNRSPLVQSFAQSIMANIRKYEESQRNPQPAGPDPKAHPLHHSKLPPQLQHSLLNWSAEINRLAQPIGWARQGAEAGGSDARGVMKSAFGEVNRNELSRVFQSLDRLLESGRQQGVDLRPFVRHNKLIPRTIAAKLRPSDLFDPVQDEERYAARAVKNSPGQLSLWDDNATGSNLLRTSARQKSFDWDESKVKRDPEGKFAEKSSEASKPAISKNEHGADVITQDHIGGGGDDGTFDRLHAGLASEIVQSKIAIGMKGIEGREYAILQHNGGRWQLVSRPGKKAEPEKEKADEKPSTKTMAEFMTQGKSFSQFTDHIKELWYDDKITESEWQSLHDKLPKIPDWADASKLTGKHFVTAFPRSGKNIIGKVEGIEITDSGIAARLVDADGKSHLISPHYLDSLKAKIGHEAKKGRLSESDLDEPHIAKVLEEIASEISDGTPIRSVIDKHFGEMKATESMVIRKALAKVREKAAEEKLEPSAARAAAMEKAKSRDAAEPKAPDSETDRKGWIRNSAKEAVKLMQESDKARKELKEVTDGKTGQWWSKFGKMESAAELRAARDKVIKSPPKYRGSENIDYEERDAREEALRLAIIAKDADRSSAMIGSKMHRQDFKEWEAALDEFSGTKPDVPAHAKSETKKQNAASKPPRGFKFDQHVKIAADSIDKLRKSDVSRLIESTPDAKTAQFVADEIAKQRPDLKSEADESIYDFMQEVNMKYAASQADAIADRFMAEAMGISIEQYAARKVKSSPGQQEFDWITVHPNGAGTKGVPVMIDRKDGTIKAGMGGKFDGQKIGEIGGGGGGEKPAEKAAAAEPRPKQDGAMAFRDKIKSIKEKNPNAKFASPDSGQDAGDARAAHTNRKSPYKDGDRITWDGKGGTIIGPASGDIIGTDHTIRLDDGTTEEVGHDEIKATDSKPTAPEAGDDGDDWPETKYTPEESAKHRDSAISKGLDRVKATPHVLTGAQAEAQAQNAWHLLDDAQKAQFSGFKEFGGAVGKAFTKNRDAAESPDAESLEDHGLYKTWNGKHYYKFRPEANWMTANSKDDAIEQATKTYRGIPADQRKTRAQRNEAADQQAFEKMDGRYGKLSIDQLEDKHAELKGAARDRSDREFTGTAYGRRTGPAVKNEGARDAGEEALQLGIYIKDRKAKEGATAKPAPAPSSFVPEMIPGQQASLFGGDDLNTGQKSLFNMVRPTKADQRAANRGAGPAPASLLEQIDDEQRKVADSRKSLPGQRDLLGGDEAGDGATAGGESGVSSYTSSMSPMASGSALKALSKPMRVEGKQTSVSELIDDEIKNGAKVTTIRYDRKVGSQRAGEIDYERKQLRKKITESKSPDEKKAMTDRLTELSNAASSGYETVTEDAIESKGGGHWTASQIGKHGIAYAKHIAGNEVNQPSQFSADQVDRFVERYRASAATAKKADAKPKTVTGTYGDRGRFITVGEGDATRPVFLPGSVKKIKETGEYRTDNSRAKAQADRKKAKASGGGKFVPVSKVEKAIVSTVGDHPTDVKEFSTIVEQVYREKAEIVRDKIAAIREITAMAGYDRKNAGGFIRSIRAAGDHDKIPRFDEMADYAQRKYPHILAEAKGYSSSHEDALFAILKDGIPEMPNKDDEDVMSAAWERSGYDQTGKPSEWESSDGGSQDEDDFVPFSASLAARMSIERYRAAPQMAGAPQFMRRR